MLRVDYDELEPSDDFLIMEYDGQPFSGVAFESDVNGSLVSETSFIEGQKYGLSREWSSSGTLIREQWFALNSLHGSSLEWYDNGAPKSNGVYELGICVIEQEWEANGTVKRVYRIDEESRQFATLKKLRTSDVGLIVGKLDTPSS